MAGVTKTNTKALHLIQQCAQRLRSNTPTDYDQIIAAVGDARVVMIGEASHGSHEFYSHRAEITKRLIKEKGFTIIACEADWPPAYRVNRWVKGFSSASNIKDADDALKEFTRFPAWMWRNTVVVDFITWLRKHNENINESKKKTGFFGIDLYSLQSSREEVLKYLDKNAPDLAVEARKCYGCFERYSDEQEYGYCAATKLRPGCEKEAIEVLKQMLDLHAKTMSEHKTHDAESEASFYAMENAKIVREAEKYYRHMFEGGEITWNIRDTHMCDCLQDLLKYNGPETKAVIWAHNSHVGDARETDSRRAREVNIGQLVRERFGIKNTFNIGFTTYTGTVTAADSWDMDPEFKRIRPSLNESVEFLLHEALTQDSTMQNDGQYYLLFRSNNSSIQLSNELHTELHKKRLERAIGVIYRPRTERQSHYFDASLSTQFDCVIHVENTRALRPLEIHPAWAQAEKDHVPDTFPMNV
ncbi:unnamed protein product [Adineta steineri]|uniref:Erythromycin esterase n=1 Tax=Adineta steineri TaxID=433720 RepID=A0A814KQT9_9BILA|nr:unnamed protein product [Adineta steineri]CAF1327254.1 unnamed protein product [Adineta steineri]